MSISEDATEGSGAAADLTPPPGCPAHLGGGGADLTALFGHEAQTDPRGLYERLRAQYGPVAPVQLEGGTEAWLVLGYRENMEAARNASRFTRDARAWNGKLEPDSPLVPILSWRPDLSMWDGDEHQRLRSALNDCLEKFDRHGVRRHIQRFAHQLVDGFVEAGHADLVPQFAGQLPMLVLTRLFGMDEQEGPKLLEANAGIVKGGEKAIEYNNYVVDTLTGLTRDRRSKPGHDFASWLVQHPSGLTDDEVIGHLRFVMVTADQTTTNLISSTLRMVLTDPRFRASLTGGLMTLPDAVEQMLWDEPPLMVCPARFATGEMSFGGQDLHEGDLLVLGLAAGNADPTVRPDLEAPMHGNRSHLAFSRGPHECPGQEIGRAITDAGVDVLLSRLPDITLDLPEDQLSWSSSTWTRNLNALPVRFAPQKRPAPTRDLDQTGVRTTPATQAAATAPAAPAAAQQAVQAAAVQQPGAGRRTFWGTLKSWLGIGGQR